MMKLSGWTNKALSLVDRNSQLIGGGFALLQTSDALQNSLARLMGGSVHPPDLNELFARFRDKPVYGQTLVAIIGGYLAQQSGIKMINKLGKIVVGAGSAYLAVRIGEAVLYSSTHSDGGGVAIGGGAAGYGY